MLDCGFLGGDAGWETTWLLGSTQVATGDGEVGCESSPRVGDGGRELPRNWYVARTGDDG